MMIRGTFLDEISHDIPHQNWGPAEWDADFAHMRAIGIDSVVLIRCGYRRWLTYPSEVAMSEEDAFEPPVDLVRLFLDLSAKHRMSFHFGLYDSGKYWTAGDYEAEVELNRRVIAEAWTRYGDHPAFAGWYLSQECSRKIGRITDLYAELGRTCKRVSDGLPVLISPYIDGPKNVDPDAGVTARDSGVDLASHEREWDEIFAGISGAVDTVAFQDGHVDFAVLEDFLHVNKRLADRHGLACWTNSESFDRDMPIRFMPIKWEKLLLKLRAAERAGITRAITFEFSHFMSPQSAYLQAGHLYNRYREYLESQR
jgi:hypothetical protein